jgi:transmembrane sensor
MSEDEDRIITEAAAWHAATDDDAMDWTAFTAWLEADSRHSRAYDEVALAVSLIDEHGPTLLSAGDSGTVGLAVAEPDVIVDRRPKWGRWAGVAIAASLAAAFLVPQFRDRSTVYQTQDAARRVALADGSSVTLAPHSRLSVTGDGQTLTLTGGAWLDIRHDSARELSISAGPLEIRDIGTSFDIQTQAKSVRIAVAEGQVTVASEALAQPIRLERGRNLLFDSAEGTALVRSQPAPEIGAWRSGRLSYEDTPLPLVLDDLSRYAGVHVTLPEDLQSRHFSGSLIISDGDAAIRDLAQVMDIPLDRTVHGYRLGERSR